MRRAIRKDTGVPVIGLCHGVHHVEGVIARFLGVQEGSISSFGIGLNHLTFLTRLYRDGQDARPLVHARLAEQKAGLKDELAGKQTWANIVEGRAPRWADDPFSWGMFEEHSIFPCAMRRMRIITPAFKIGTKRLPKCGLRLWRRLGRSVWHCWFGAIRRCMIQHCASRHFCRM